MRAWAIITGAIGPESIANIAIQPGRDKMDLNGIRPLSAGTELVILLEMLSFTP
jgi:hypothetical protein